MFMHNLIILLNVEENYKFKGSLGKSLQNHVTQVDTFETEGQGSHMIGAGQPDS
jgi:hypothetical protein